MSETPRTAAQRDVLPPRPAWATGGTAPRDIVRHPEHPEVRLPRSPGRGSDAALKIAALLGATEDWEAATLEQVADILGEHGFTHPGNADPDEVEAYTFLAYALGVIA